MELPASLCNDISESELCQIARKMNFEKFMLVSSLAGWKYSALHAGLSKEACGFFMFMIHKYDL